MTTHWDDQRKLERDIEKCVSLIQMYSEIADSGKKEMPKAQLYHLVTALLGFLLWGDETTISRVHNIHGAIPMLSFFEGSKYRKITLLEAIKNYGDPKVIEITKKGKNTFFKVGKLGEYNQKKWTSEEEKIIREIIYLREKFGSQTYAILGLSNPQFLEDSILWLEKQAIDSLRKCTKAVSESGSKSEINRRLRDCAKFVRSALDKIKAYQEIYPQIEENLEKKGIFLPIDLSFPDLESLEKVLCLRREEISELRHIAFSRFRIGKPDRDSSHIGDISNLDEADIAEFFEYVELILSKEEAYPLEKYLEIQVIETSSEFDKSVFELLLAMVKNMRWYNE